MVHWDNAQEIQLDRHRTLGSVLHIGPNCISLSAFDAIQTSVGNS